MKIRVVGIFAIFAILLTGCSTGAQRQLGNDPDFMESLLLTEQDASVEIAEVLDEPIFFGLDYGLFPSSECDAKVGEEMLLATTNYSANFRFENQEIENFVGYVQQQVVGFEEEGVGEKLFSRIIELASSGVDCDRSSEINGIGFILDYKPVVNLPDDVAGFEWSEANYPSYNKCSEGSGTSGVSNYSVLSKGNLLVITKVWNLFCYSGVEDHDAASEIVKTLSKEILKTTISKF